MWGDSPNNLATVRGACKRPRSLRRRDDSGSDRRFGASFGPTQTRALHTIVTFGAAPPRAGRSGAAPFFGTWPREYPARGYAFRYGAH